MPPPVGMAASVRRTLTGATSHAVPAGVRQVDEPARLSPPHVEFLGLPFCLLNLDETVQSIVARSQESFVYVVTPNAQHVVAVHEQREVLLDIYRNAWLSLCDSQIVRGLAALEGLSLPLVTGSDLVAALLAAENARPATSRPRRFLVVGPDVAIEQTLRARYPHTSIDVLPAPLRLVQRGDLRLEVASACVQRSWDVLLLCVGAPAQEMIAALIAERGCKSGVALCVGAAVDFITGRRTRAPRFLRQLG